MHKEFAIKVKVIYGKLQYKLQDTRYKTVFKLGMVTITNNISYKAINRIESFHNPLTQW